MGVAADSVPCHMSRRSMLWFQNHCYDPVTPDVWPPNSPNLNPMDYFVWGYVERTTNARPHNNKESLVASIKELISDMDPELVARGCSCIRSRVEAVVAAKGDFIE